MTHHDAQQIIHYLQYIFFAIMLLVGVVLGATIGGRR